MALAKARKMNPRQLAADVVARLEAGPSKKDLLDYVGLDDDTNVEEFSDYCEPVEIAGAGFLNFRLQRAALAHTLESVARGEHLFFELAPQPRTVVLDFSSPNVAKPMHVGHIRSTILGDSLARTLRLLGHRVITDNHLGDWGTQFGMLIVGWIYATACGQDPSKMADPIDELERLYKLVSAASKGEPEALGVWRAKLQPPLELTERFFEPDGILHLARYHLVKLQSGDWENSRIWKDLILISRKQFDTIYQRLGVKFDHTLGESFYHPRLRAVVDELMRRGIATESRGARAILSDGSVPPKDDPFLIHKEGEWIANPFIIQKSDGGFNYASTDLATLAHRIETWQADEIIYVTDGRQQLHFQQLFAAFKRWHPESKTRQIGRAHV